MLAALKLISPPPLPPSPPPAPPLPPVPSRCETSAHRLCFFMYPNSSPLLQSEIKTQDCECVDTFILSTIMLLLLVLQRLHLHRIDDNYNRVRVHPKVCHDTRLNNDVCPDNNNCITEYSVMYTHIKLQCLDCWHIFKDY